MYFGRWRDSDNKQNKRGDGRQGYCSEEENNHTAMGKRAIWGLRVRGRAF